MNAIDNYPGSLVVRSALQLMALTFCRSGEIRRAEYLPERRKMMQTWPDYLDELRVKAKTDLS